MSPREAVRSLLIDLGARAAGCWRVEGDRLVQAAFVGAENLPVEVAREFATATSSVPLDRIELGIVRACVEGVVAVSIAAELPPDVGSGLWLRRFGAERSVAVPIEGSGGVVSVALASRSIRQDEVIARIREAGRVVFS